MTALDGGAGACASGKEPRRLRVACQATADDNRARRADLIAEPLAANEVKVRARWPSRPARRRANTLLQSIARSFNAPYEPPVPNRLLRLFGGDSRLPIRNRASGTVGQPG
jgi:hypothetical protein